MFLRKAYQVALQLMNAKTWVNCYNIAISDEKH